MLKDLTQTKLLLSWCSIVALMIGVMLAFGVTMNLATGVMLVALCLAPPLIIYMLWPGVPAPTVTEVLRHEATKE
jgi:hypothetical protein